MSSSRHYKLSRRDYGQLYSALSNTFCDWYFMAPKPQNLTYSREYTADVFGTYVSYGFQFANTNLIFNLLWNSFISPTDYPQV